MINVSNDFKNELRQPKTIDAKIVIGGSTITSNELNSIQRVFKTSLFKTVMKQVNVDSNTTIAKDSVINPQFGLYIGNAFEYVSLGSFKVKDEPILNKDTNSYEITSYDKIVESMIPYALDENDITYPCTVRDLFVAIFTKLGWAITGIPATFVNSTSNIEEDVFSNVNMTYRDVLDELCTISCMFLIDNGNPTLIQKTTTTEIINEYNMKNTNVAIKNRVFFNSLVFSRAEESDNIYRKDDTSITNYCLHEFKVSDLQILSLNWRDNFIDAMWNYIKTFEYYSYDVDTYGIAYLEPIDQFTLSIFNDTYTTLLLCSDLTISNGAKEKIYADEPVESETEYKYADTTDKKINQTTLTVDKQKGQIQALVSKTTIVSDKIKANNLIQLTNAYEGELHYLSIKGNLHLLTPSNTLYPSDDLTIIAPILLVDNTEYLLDIDYLNYVDDEECDEFIYEDGKCKIIRRVNVAEETEEERQDISIKVNSNSTIKMKYFNNLTYECSYLLQNDFTSTFSNHVETKSEINILSNSIEQKVSQVADDDGNVTSASIILAVNNDESTANIQAKKINLNGLVTANENFKIMEDGSMEAKNGKFKGLISGGAISITGDYTETDPYIEVVSPASTGVEPIGTNIWTNGISCYDYSGNAIPVIRTENSNGYAELSGEVVNAYGFNNVSLEEQKKNFEKFSNALEIIKDIDLYKYHYKNENDEAKKHIGIIIGKNYKYREEVTNQNNSAVDLYSLVAVCCQAIKEQQKEIEKLKKEME